jgi:hypothetical protein
MNVTRAIENGRDALKARLAELHEVYNAMPRRAKVCDRYCKVARGIEMTLEATNEAIRAGDWQPLALKRMRRAEWKVATLIKALGAAA